MVAVGDLIAAAKIIVAAILPGLPLAWGIVRRAKWDPLAILPLSFAATLAFAGLVGVTGRMMGFDLALASWLFIGVATLSGVGGVWYGLRAPTDAPATSDTVAAPSRRIRFGWQGLVLGTIAGATALWQHPWIAFTTDTFYHLAAVRSLIATGRTMVTDPMHGTDATALDATSGLYHTWLAMVARVAAEPVELLLVGATALGAAMVIWAMWVLAERVSGSPWAATFATTGFAVFSLYSDFRMFGYPNRLSLALVFIALLALMDLAEENYRPAAIALGVSGFAVLGVHMGSAAFVGVVAAMFVLWWAVWGVVNRKEEGAFKPFLRLAIPLLILLLVASPVIVSKLPSVLSSEIFTGDIPLKARETALLFITDSILVVRPGVFVGGGAVAFWATLGAAVLAGIGAFRFRRREDLPIVALLGVPALLLFNPPVTSLAVAVTYYTFARVALLLGFIPWLALAWVSAEAFRSAGKRRVIVGLLAVAIVLSEAIVMWGPTKVTWVRVEDQMRVGESYTVFESREADVRNGWGDALWDVKVALGDGYPRVAADPETGYYLAGLAPVSIVAAPRSHSPLVVELVDGPARREDMGRLTDPATSEEDRRTILERYEADYVVLSPGTGNDALAYESMLQQSDLFEIVVDTRRLVLFRVVPAQ